jgi:hypothetical protein
MSERPATDPNLLPDPLHQEVSRRSLVSFGGAIVATSMVPGSIRQLAENAGGLYDTLTSPEDIIAGPIVALEPRENATPVVAPRPRAESTAIGTRYTRKGNTTLLSFVSGTPLRAEHSNAQVNDSEYTAAGTAIITTAEGLTNGDQAYCQLFKGKDRVVAVGYEGGLFVYEPALSQDKGKTGGEWVRLLTQNEDSPLPSQAVATATWEDLQTVSPHKMLIQDVVEGTKTLQELGYKPWAAVLPSTRMPDSLRFTFAPETCAQNNEELIAGEKRYFVTERGDIADLQHLQAKAGETLKLFTQLHYQYIAGEARPKARVTYSAGNESSYVFSVDRDSLSPDNLIDTTFSIMNAVTMYMEGVSQRYAAEKIPVIGTRSQNNGMNPEDLFANSLGITGMLSLIRQHGLAEKLEEPLRAIHGRHPDAPSSAVQAAVENVIEEVKPLLVKQVLARVAHAHGVRKQATPVTIDLPRGMYPLVPTKATDKDGATPTRIDLKTAGIRPDNPHVRYKPVHVAAMQAAVSHLLD